MPSEAIPAASPSRAASPRRRGTAWLLTVVLAAGALAYAGGLDGSFVYDDTHQILDNHYLRSPAGILHGLTADVWSFKGEREEAWSNYWRPVFVAWLGAQALLFGTGSAVPWHAASLALHLLVTALAFGLARRLGLPAAGAASLALLFAVHPVHVESVAWVSGSPDLLAAAGMLAALILWIDGERRADAVRRAAALLAYAGALGSKEIAVLLPPLVPLALWAADRDRRLKGRIWWHAVPFASLAALFLLARHAVLGRLEIELPWRLGPADLLLTLPATFAFYLRQALLPWRLSPAYPLRPLHVGAAGAGDLVAPLLWVLGFLVWAAWAARRDRRATFGLALFLLPLAPAMNLNAFIPEQLVHDRYLYLPSLGLLLALVATTPLRSATASARGRRIAWAAALAVAVLFALRTVRYAEVWGSAERLWSRAVAVDPGSSHSWSELGNALAAAGRRDEAMAAFDRALELVPVTAAYLGRADLLIEQGRLEEARRDLQAVVRVYPARVDARERLASVLQRGGRLEEAEGVLREGRELAPYRTCTLTVDLAIVHYLQGRRKEALAELEEARRLVPSSPRAGCWQALFHLGNLYRELGRSEDSRRAFAEYLDASAPATDEASRSYRALARRALRQNP